MTVVYYSILRHGCRLSSSGVGVKPTECCIVAERGLSPTAANTEPASVAHKILMIIILRLHHYTTTPTLHNHLTGNHVNNKQSLGDRSQEGGYLGVWLSPHV